MQENLTYYVNSICRMRTDSGKNKYPETTHHRAPHKPILLLAIFDLFDQNVLTANFVPLSPELAELFATYWEHIMPSDRTARMFLPFFHMKNDGFWQLVPYRGQEIALEAIQQIGGAAQLRDTVLCGQFDDDLFKLILVEESRAVLRAAVIETYFSKTVQSVLMELANTNLIAHQYSVELLDLASGREKTVSWDDDESQRPARDQGFRKAIVAAYDHRCVLCGVRLVTHEGRTAATAAHIIPWSVSHNDDPRNGLCLCRLCHWTFDVGLASITTKYRIRLSSQLNEQGNVSGYLSTLSDRPIFEPTEEAFNPDIDALKWHTTEVFLA